MGRRAEFRQQRKACSGNALFLILIAVALFAALSYAVTQSGRGGGTIDRETGLLQAASMTEQAAKVQQAIARMRLLNKCTETNISFENPTVAGYANAAAPADKSCHVFDPAGGGLIYSDLMVKTDWMRSGVTTAIWAFSARDEMQGVGETCGADSCVDMIAYFPDVDREICLAINRGLGIDNPGGDPPVDLDIVGGKFTGLYEFNTTIGDEVGGEELIGADAACFTQTTDGRHFFYTVLIAR